MFVSCFVSVLIVRIIIVNACISFTQIFYRISSLNFYTIQHSMNCVESIDKWDIIVCEAYLIKAVPEAGINGRGK